MIVTETKMVVGTILKVSRSKPRCTLWGEYLFHAREVVIRIKKTRKPKVLKMYIREDSLLSQMKVPPNALINKSFQVTVHGEAVMTLYFNFQVWRFAISLSLSVRKEVQR